MRFRHLSAAPRPSAQRRRLVLGLLSLAAAGCFALLIAHNQPPPPQNGTEAKSSIAIAPVGIEVASSAPAERIPGGDAVPVESAAPRRRTDRETAPASAALDKAVLLDARDDTLGIRHSEAEAFFTLLDHVRRVPAAELESAARRNVQYAHLMTDPSSFRGEVVTVSGTLRRCEEFAAVDASRAPHRLYEAWVLCDDAGGQPCRIVAANVDPRALHPGDAHIPVRITGCFFKREGYEASGGLRVAPTILAKSIEVDWANHRPALTSGAPPMLPGLAVAIGLIFAFTLLALAWTERRPRRLPALLSPLPSTIEAAAAEIDRRSLGEQLRGLSERHRFGGK
jgi:hypothetical protein